MGDQETEEKPPEPTPNEPEPTPSPPPDQPEAPAASPEAAQPPPETAPPAAEEAPAAAPEDATPAAEAAPRASETPVPRTSETPAPRASETPAPTADAVPEAAPATEDAPAAPSETPAAPTEGAEAETKLSSEAAPGEKAEQAPGQAAEDERHVSITKMQEQEQPKSKTSVLKGSGSQGSKMKIQEAKKVSSIKIDARTSSQKLITKHSSEIGKVQSSIDSFGKRKSGSSKSVDSKDMSQRKSRLTMKAQKAIGSIISIRRLSNAGDMYDKTKGARYMNTYKLDSDKPFNPEKVQKILVSVMEEALANLNYDPENIPKQAKWASSAIRGKVKELEFDRYKLVCLVTIGEKTSQDVLVSCRFLWDSDRDRYAVYSLENTYVFGIAQCFGLYYE